MRTTSCISRRGHGPTRGGGWASRAWRWTGPWGGCADERADDRTGSRQACDSARAETGSPGFDEIEREELSRLFGRRRMGAGWRCCRLWWGWSCGCWPPTRRLAGWLLAISSCFGVGVLPWWKAGRTEDQNLHRGTVRINLTFAVLAQAAATFPTAVWAARSCCMFPHRHGGGYHRPAAGALLSGCLPGCRPVGHGLGRGRGPGTQPEIWSPLGEAHVRVGVTRTFLFNAAFASGGFGWWSPG